MTLVDTASMNHDELCVQTPHGKNKRQTEENESTRVTSGESLPQTQLPPVSVGLPPPQAVYASLYVYDTTLDADNVLDARLSLSLSNSRQPANNLGRSTRKSWVVHAQGRPRPRPQERG